MRLIRLLKYDLAMEISSWVKDGLITREQAESVCSRYGIDFNKLTRKSLGYQVLVSLGFLFIGLSLITIIGANWDAIPRALRMSGLIALTLGVNLFGLYRFRKDRASRAMPWFFLGGLLYGASIMLIAQIYHIGEHYPDGIFWWAMGVLPIGLLLESGLIMMLATALGFTWFFVESFLNFYPALFPLFLFALAWHLSRGKRNYVLFIALVVGVGFWAEYALAWLLSDTAGFDAGPENVALGAAIFLAYHGVAKWLVTRENPVLADYGTILGVWVLRFAIISLLVFSFEAPWRELIQATWQVPGAAVAMTLCLSILALGFAWRARTSMVSVTAFALVVNLSLISVLMVDKHWALAFQFAYNIMLVGTGLWLIVRGIQNNVSHYFYLGVVAILITGLLRYIDLFKSYVGASVMFAVFAGVLLLAARYWKARHAITGEAQP